MEWIIGLFILYGVYHLVMGYLIQRVKDANARKGIK